MSVRRIFAEKKEPYAVKAQELMEEMSSYLDIHDAKKVRVLIRYDVENLSDETYEKSKGTIFSEPPVDDLYEGTFPHEKDDIIFSVEYLPGQFDQRADSAEQCVKLLNEKENPVIRSATTYIFEGEIAKQDEDRIKEYCINPVDSREALENIPDTLVQEFDEPADVAVFDGFRVMPMDEAAKIGDVFLTLTGDKDILRERHFASMKDGAVMANSGHFDVEINIPELESMTVSRRPVREGIEEFKFENGKKLYLLGEGRLVNLACGDGHPAEIMDLSWGVQFFSALYMIENHDKLENKVYVLPAEVDEKIARIKLKAMGVEIDTLTPEQYAYLHQC